MGSDCVRGEFGPGGAFAVLAEYDALPGIGHGCGHNLIAAAGVGAGLALASLGAALPGRVRLLGTPAEERGCGKELMARRGALDGVDAALMIHPASVNLVTMPCVCLAELDVVARAGRHAADATAVSMHSTRSCSPIGHRGAAPTPIHRAHPRHLHRRRPGAQCGAQRPRPLLRARPRLELEALPRVEAASRQARGYRRRQGCASAADYLDIRYNEPLAKRFDRTRRSSAASSSPTTSCRRASGTDMGNVSQRIPSIHRCWPRRRRTARSQPGVHEVWLGDGRRRGDRRLKALAMTRSTSCRFRLRERAARSSGGA
jgi:metal-dependent amidase/aminoacylase/carboxypeptidase family protein